MSPPTLDGATGPVDLLGRGRCSAGPLSPSAAIHEFTSGQRKITSLKGKCLITALKISTSIRKIPVAQVKSFHFRHFGTWAFT